MELRRLDRKQIKTVYKERMVIDFPRDELRSLKMINNALDRGIYECLGLFDENEIIGYAYLVKLEKNYLLDYLAIYPEHRDSGAGGKVLQFLGEYLSDADNIIIEVENPEFAKDEAEKELRTRRLGFYLRNNCRDTGIRIRCFKVPFQILALGEYKCKDTDVLCEMYKSFYREVLPGVLYKRCFD